MASVGESQVDFEPLLSLQLIRRPLGCKTSGLGGCWTPGRVETEGVTITESSSSEYGGGISFELSKSMFSCSDIADDCEAASSRSGSSR